MKSLRFAVVCMLLSAVPASASDQGGNLKEPAPIWAWLNFLILAGVLGYLVSKYLGPILANRTKTIQEGLAAGERAKAEAEARSAAVQAKLSDLDFQVSLMSDAAKQEREREAERIRQHAEQEIESAAKLARLEVQRFAAKMAIELAERKVRARMSPEVESALLGNFLDDLADNRARHAE